MGDSIRGYQNTLRSFINTLSYRKTCVTRNSDNLSKILSILKIIASIGVCIYFCLFFPWGLVCVDLGG